jgi:hypothetical protein
MAARTTNRNHYVYQGAERHRQDHVARLLLPNEQHINQKNIGRVHQRPETGACIIPPGCHMHLSVDHQRPPDYRQSSGFRCASPHSNPSQVALKLRLMDTLKNPQCITRLLRPADILLYLYLLVAKSPPHLAHHISLLCQNNCQVGMFPITVIPHILSISFMYCENHARSPLLQPSGMAPPNCWHPDFTWPGSRLLLCWDKRLDRFAAAHFQPRRSLMPSARPASRRWFPR